MEFDLDRLKHDRMLLNRSWDGERVPMRLVPFTQHTRTGAESTANSPMSPFLPGGEEEADYICRQAFAIQSTALAKRMMHTRAKSFVIGVSGGLDSALALMVAGRTAEICGLPQGRASSAWCDAGAGQHGRDPNPGAAAHRRGRRALPRDPHRGTRLKAHLKDIGHSGKPDIAFENAQARERTQILMDLANMEGRASSSARGIFRSWRWASAPTTATICPCTASTPGCPRRSSVRWCCVLSAGIGGGGPCRYRAGDRFHPALAGAAAAGSFRRRPPPDHRKDGGAL